MKRKEKNMARIAYGFNTIMSLCWHASLLGQKWDFILSLVISNCQSYVYKIIHILQEYTHTKTYTSPNLKGCFQEVEEMEQQMTSSKQSEGGKRKKKDKTG